MAAVLRILDANLNRAREAMRGLEDLARFALDDPRLSGDCKALRHDLRGLVEALPVRPGQIEFSRDTPGDVGTSMSNPAEMQRESLLEVAMAAGKRLGESLRVLEEAGKTIDPLFAAGIKAIRYRAYDIESRLLARMGTGCAVQWRLCLLLTQSLCRRPWRDVLRSAIDGGADCIQVREKQMDGGELAGHAREVIAIARASGVCVIINDRVDVALATGADGVHLGQHDVAVRDARMICGRTLLIGVSTHTMDEAEAAIAAGADYCGVGAMFPTAQKAGRVPSGPAYLEAFLSRFPNTPHLAIGGITPKNIGELARAGVRGIAVSTAICAAEDPRAAAAELVSGMSLASPPVAQRA